MIVTEKYDCDSTLKIRFERTDDGAEYETFTHFKNDVLKEMESAGLQVSLINETDNSIEFTTEQLKVEYPTWIYKLTSFELTLFVRGGIMNVYSEKVK